VVALGAVGLQGILGKAASISSLRGQNEPLPDGSLLVATIHPSMLLRIRGHRDPEPEYRAFVADLQRAAALAARGEQRGRRGR
jgi:uracil-DNA glycosylase